jgi:ABC-2 type transport system ATP-binding protein
VSGVALHVESLTKVFGRRTPVTAVKDLSFSVAPGRVTGFLGPNGSGKTTTLRCLLGLVAPTSGRALIGEHRYRELEQPILSVGAALEDSGFHPGRTARNHLRVVAAAAGLPDSRVDEVLQIVGLHEAGRRRVVEYSLGMRQRLALAGALIGDPDVLILDEPANGLDPEGIAWLRAFLRDQASRGCTVLVSSHVLSEVQQTVDDVVIISRGVLVHAGPLDQIGDAGTARTLVRSPDLTRLADIISASGVEPTQLALAEGALTVLGLTTDEVGRLAFSNGIELHELSNQSQDLEKLFLELTGGTE